MSFEKAKDHLKKYKLVHDYTFKHFKDEEYGEWYGYLRRDGVVSTDLKGNIFKGPFHIPRCELENILLIKEGDFMSALDFFLIISFGTIKPEINITNCKIKDDIMFFMAFLL